MRRREYEVKLRERSDGLHELDYIDPITGKRARRTFSKKRIAEQERKAIEHAIEESRNPAGMTMRVGEVAQTYIANYKGEPTGRRAVDSRLRNHVLPRWKHMLVGKVYHNDIQDWLDMELAPAMSPHSANACVAALAAVLMRAERDKLIPISPCRGIKRLPQPVRHIAPTLLPEYQAALRALPEHYKLAAFLGLATGARAQEVLGLTCDKVDFDALTITIDRQLVAGGFGVAPKFRPTKGKDRRILPVSELVIDIVRRHVDLFYVDNPDQLLSIDDDGWPLGYDRFNYYWRQAREGTGMTRFHDVRHLSASLAKAAGADLLEIKERHGHKQLTTTAALYPGVIGPQVTSVRAMDAALASVELHGRSEPR